MSAKRPFATFTIARNEPFYLPLWCGYHSRSFPLEDTNVLDNSTSDGSIERIKERWPTVNVVSRPSDRSFVHQWLKETVQQFQRELLERYEVVVFTEADEFLIPSATWGGLRKYLESFAASPKQYVRATAWSVVHQIDTEPALRLHDGCDVLADRNAMWRMPFYDKTLITKVPLTYGRGFHRIYLDGAPQDDRPEREPDLDMLHAWQVDMMTYHQRVVDRLAAQPAEKIHGSADIEQVKTLFRTNTTPWDPGRDKQQPYVEDRCSVPDHWRNLITW
jgi:hypothetical protein